MPGSNRITLVYVDGVDPNVGARVLNHCASQFAARAKLLSFVEPTIPYAGEFVRIEKLDYLGWNNFVLSRLADYIDTDFALILHPDGFIHHPEQWTDEFLNYDYIGAPWREIRHNRVGNGGFSLRSKRLLEWGRGRRCDWLEDVLICLDHFEEINSLGMRFAPLELAMRFSLEHPLLDFPGIDLDGAFGFHGKYTPYRRALCRRVALGIATPRFCVGVATLNRFDLLARCLDSVLSGSAKPERVYVVDNSGGQWEGHPSPIVQTIVPPYNLGCSRSWNLLLQLTQPAPCVILSDDIEVGHNTLERMVCCESPLVVADERHAMMAFLISPDIWRDVGRFDEVFYPIYHEDNDYCYRARLKGYELTCPVSDGFVDHGPSATYQRWPSGKAKIDFDRRLAFCRQYYRDKWGGRPTQETFTTSFNGAAKDVLDKPLDLMNADIADLCQESPDGGRI
jgi:hypothetical protein